MQIYFYDIRASGGYYLKLILDKIRRRKVFSSKSFYFKMLIVSIILWHGSTINNVWYLIHLVIIEVFTDFRKLWYSITTSVDWKGL